MAFTNTVEAVGDAALTRSIIDKSITELSCNLTTSIRKYAFRECAALANVNFPSVTSVELGAFWSCAALQKADFAACVAFSNNAFYGCSALETVILRCTDQLCSISGTPFANSAIASGTGYIYVPAALVDTYKASWTAYADQIRAIEDYPVICNPYTWETVFSCIDDGTYGDVYKVGDCVELDLGSEGVVNMQIAGIDADDLADGSGKAPISWISKELLATKHRMNPDLTSTTDDDGNTVYTEGTGTIGGWEKCEMRAYLKETVKPLIPDAVRNRIATVTKTQKAFDTSGTEFTQTTQDDVWLPSSTELSDELFYKNLFAKEGRKKKYGSSYATWWCRSCYQRASINAVFSSGSVSATMPSSACGVALGFCT